MYGVYTAPTPDSTADMTIPMTPIRPMNCPTDTPPCLVQERTCVG
jgi:hypothetical protein